MMRRTSILAGAALLAGWGAVSEMAAQSGRTNPRLAQAQDPKYVQGLCPLRPGHKQVEAGITALRKAYDAKTPDEKTRVLGEAQQTLVAAIAQGGQAGNGAAWYYLARVALLQGDPIGTDSAFTKAEELVPACEIDISRYRQNSWAALGQAGLELQRAGDTEGALQQFRDASYMFRGLPHIYSNMGVIFANSGRTDSAAFYFEKALQIGETDSELSQDRDNAAQNLALMYIRANRHMDAIKVLHKSRAWDSTSIALRRTELDSLRKQTVTPAIAGRIDTLQAELGEIATRLNDTEKTMAISFRNAGMNDSAEALEGRLIARFSATNLDSLETSDLLTVGVAAYNAGRFAEAERAFGKAAERNPWSRDARYNASITQLAVSRQAKDSADALRRQARTTRNPSAAVRARLADTVKYDTESLAGSRKLVTEAIKLAEIDPMNEDVLRILAQGYRGLREDSSAYKTAERLVALPFSVEITVFQMGASRALLAAEASGRNPTDPEGKPIKVAPMTLVFEFLDAKGAVLDSKEVNVPVLTSSQKQSIEIEGKGNKIVAWRYRPKPA
ncbi:MAG: hypothetical protein ACT4PM_13895 [Gemmatimonadales bacterium]